MKIWAAIILPLTLWSTAAAAADGVDKHFLIMCALFKLGSSTSKPEAKDLNLLVNQTASADGLMAVVETFDPAHIVPAGNFANVSFDKSGRTKFTALTGPVHDPGTWLLGGTLVEEGAYDVLLGKVATRNISFKGRCWMSNIASADQEFEKLKAGHPAL